MKILQQRINWSLLSYIIVTAESLDYEMKKIDEKIAKIKGRTPKELRDKIIK